MAGDTVTILGGGFSPTPGQNQVMIGGVQASVTSETEYEVKATVPYTLVSPQFVYVMLKRGDTQEVGNGFGAFWLNSPSSLFRLGPIPGQAPGSQLEQNDLAAEVPDTPLAKDYERYATAAEAVQGLLSKRGELLTSSGSAATTIEAAGSGMVLESRSTEGSGLRWVAPQRRITYSWGGLVGTSSGYLAANGTGASALGSGDWHGVPVQSEVVNITIYVQESVTGSALLNQFILYNNGSAIVTSGASLGLTEGGYKSHNVSSDVYPGDILTVQVVPSGSAGSIRVVAGVALRERGSPSAADIVGVTDTAETLVVGAHVRSPLDEVSALDSVIVK